MRRTLRWIITLGGGILFVAALVAWPRSYWASDLMAFPVPRLSSESASSTQLIYGKGGLLIHVYTQRASPEFAGSDPLGGRTRKALVLRSNDPGNVLLLTDWSYFGFGAASQVTRSHGIDETMRFMVVPLWFVAAASGTTFLAGARAIRRARAAGFIPNQCKSCGYDLRAGHDKCPECGGESHVKVGAVDSTNTPTAPSGQR